MVPDKFNMVDMEGIDILFSHGDIIPGLYQKLVESIAQCRYQCLYNWYSDGVLVPPTYVEMTVNQDTNDVWINGGVFVTSDDRILVHLPSIETVSGAIVNITDALPRKVEGLICYINPFQSGSGNASPNNIRPISGFSEINVYGDETYDVLATPKLTINWEDEAGTIYGGRVTFNDDGSADVVANMAVFTATSSNSIARTNDIRTSISNTIWGSTSNVSNKCIRIQSSTFNSGGAGFIQPGSTLSVGYWRLLPSSETTPEIVSSWLDGSVKFCLVLQNPFTYHFDNIGQLYTRLGTNVIWHDANGDISVTYWKE